MLYNIRSVALVRNEVRVAYAGLGTGDCIGYTNTVLEAGQVASGKCCEMASFVFEVSLTSSSWRTFCAASLCLGLFVRE